MPKNFRLSQSGVAHILVLLVVILGIVAGTVLVQNPQIFKPRAYEVNQDEPNQSDRQENIQANYADWITKMQSLGIYPAKEDGEIVLYNKQDFVEKYCGSQVIPGTTVASTGCYFNPPTSEETLDAAKSDVNFIKELGVSLKDNGYAPLTVLKTYFPDVINIDQSLYLQLEALEPICRQEDDRLVCREGDEEIKREISPEELSRIIEQLSLEKHLSEKDPIQKLVNITDPVFGTRALINWATLPPHKATDEDRINAVLGMTVIYGMSEKVASVGLRYTQNTVIDLARIIREIKPTRENIIGGKNTRWSHVESLVIQTMKSADNPSFENKISSIVFRDYTNKKTTNPKLDITESDIKQKLQELGYPEEKIPNEVKDIKAKLLEGFPELTQGRSLEELQSIINQRGYSVPLSVVNVPRPVRSNAINPELAQKWIEAHPEGVARDTARAIITETRHISQEEFEAALQNSIKSFNKAIGSEDYIVFVEDRKSNKWVAELALPELDHLPRKVISLSDFDDVLNIESMKKYRFVFFDDGIYSGSQMRGYIGGTIQKAQSEGIDPSKITIDVIAPYSTGYGRAYIQTTIQSQYYAPTAEINFHITEVMPSVSEVLAKYGDDVNRVAIKTYGSTESRTLTYFDHKIPDSVSTFEDALIGRVFNQSGYVTDIINYIPRTIPPYK